MFKVDEYVMYSLLGVCRIVAIRREKDIGGNETEYYVLQPAYDNNIVIKTPTNNPKLLMRRIITRAGALSLIATMPEMDTVWISDNKQRGEVFRGALRTGKSEELVRIIKAVYQEKKVKTAAGRKMMKSDEDAMKVAEKQLYQEFAIALSISPDEVVGFISSMVGDGDRIMGDYATD